MKKLSGLILLITCLALPSFANDVVGHGVKVAGKDSARVTAAAANGSAKPVVAIGKFLF